MKDSFEKIFRHWKILYAVCCLVYTGWMIQVADVEFYRINSQYRQLKAQLHPDRVRQDALEELIRECYQKNMVGGSYEMIDCSTFPDRILEDKIAAVEKRYLEAKQRGTVKATLFYTGFVLIFLLAPMILGYLLIAAIILLYKNIKIVRR
jgi:hypothetical protein